MIEVVHIRQVVGMTTMERYIRRYGFDDVIISVIHRIMVLAYIAYAIFSQYSANVISNSIVPK